MNKSVHLFRYHKRSAHCIALHWQWNDKCYCIHKLNAMFVCFVCLSIENALNWIGLFNHSNSVCTPGHLHKCNYAVIYYLHIHRVSIFFGLEVIVQLEYIHITMESCEHNQKHTMYRKSKTIEAIMCRMYSIKEKYIVLEQSAYLPAIMNMRMNLHTWVNCTTTDVATNIKMA